MFTNSTGSDIISAHDFMKLRVRHPALASSTQPTPMVQERPPSPARDELENGFGARRVKQRKGP